MYVSINNKTNKIKRSVESGYERKDCLLMATFKIESPNQAIIFITSIFIIRELI